MSNEIDLHGYEVSEALEAFIEHYNERVKRGDFSSILVIHGYGSTGDGGKIRMRLRSFLTAHSGRLLFQPGENLQFHNLGETIVYPKEALPSSLDLLGAEILSFCESPKTRSKITGKFRKYGETKIQATLKTLEKQKRLTTVSKGPHKLYLATTS